MLWRRRSSSASKISVVISISFQEVAHIPLKKKCKIIWIGGVLRKKWSSRCFMCHNFWKLCHFFFLTNEFHFSLVPVIVVKGEFRLRSQEACKVQNFSLSLKMQIYFRNITALWTVTVSDPYVQYSACCFFFFF